MECPDCNSSKIYVDWFLGEYYCYDCGLIIEDNIVDFSDKSFAFDSEGNLKGYGATDLTKADRGLGTSIQEVVSALVKHLDSTFFNTPVENVERSFSQAQPVLQKVWSSLNLSSDLKTNSAMLYRKCIRKQMTKGRKTEEMALAVVYVACKRSGMHRDIAKTAKELSISMDTVQAYCKAIDDETSPKTKLFVQDYVKKCTDSLKLPDQLTDIALKLNKKVTSKKLEIGKHPAVVAGAIVYKAGLENHEELSQAKIAKALSVSERSIRRIVKELENY